MLIAKIEHQRVHVEGNGSLDDIISDISQIVGSIHAQMMTADPDAASDFRRVITALLADHDSPVWKMNPAVGGIASVVPVGQE